MKFRPLIFTTNSSDETNTALKAKQKIHSLHVNA